MRVCLYLFLALSLTGCAGSRPRYSKAELDGMFRSGLDRFEAGDFRTALRRFQLVRDVDPRWPGLQHRVGLCYAKLGLPALAVESLRLAVREAPESADVKLDLAVALELSSSPREAEGIYLGLVQTHPGDPRVALNLGLLYARRLKEPEKARVQLRRYLELDPSSADAPEIRKWLEKQEKDPAAEAPPPPVKVISSKRN